MRHFQTLNKAAALYSAATFITHTIALHGAIFLAPHVDQSASERTTATTTKGMQSIA